jgi:hypothetical protein
MYTPTQWPCRRLYVFPIEGRVRSNISLRILKASSGFVRGNDNLWHKSESKLLCILQFYNRVQLGRGLDANINKVH